MWSWREAANVWPEVPRESPQQEPNIQLPGLASRIGFPRRNHASTLEHHGFILESRSITEWRQIGRGSRQKGIAVVHLPSLPDRAARGDGPAARLPGSGRGS